MGERLLRKVIREALLLEATMEDVITGTWPSGIKSLFYGAGDGRGRGEYLLVLAIAGVESLPINNVAIDAANKEYKEAKNSDERKDALRKLDAIAADQIPASVKKGTQGTGKSFDVLLTSPAEAAIAAEGEAAGWTFGDGIPGLLDVEVEVKEPDAKDQFRMAAEGQAFINSSRAWTHLRNIAQKIKDMEIALAPVFEEIRASPETRKELVALPSGNLVDEIFRQGSTYMKDADFISRGEGPAKSGRLEMISGVVSALKDFSKATISPDSLLNWASYQDDSGNHYTVQEEILKSLDELGRNMWVVKDIPTTPADYFKEVVRTADLRRKLFEAPWVALVLPDSYRIYPTDMELLFEQGLLTLVGLTQGSRPRWQVQGIPGTLEAPEESSDSDAPQLDTAGKSYKLDSVLSEILLEELTKTDVQSIAKKEAEKEVKKQIEDAVAKEVERAFNTRATKDQMADISKKILKKFYREISHSYSPQIDRIKL